MKKLIFAVCAILLSQPAAAFFEEETAVSIANTVRYVGQGTALSSNPEVKSSRFRAATEARLLGEGVTLVVNRLQSANGDVHEWSYRARVNSKRPNFYTLYDLDGEQVIGEGYCFMFAEYRGKKCHYELSIDGVAFEQTFTVLGSKIFRMTSMKEGNDLKVWREGLALDALPPTP